MKKRFIAMAIVLCFIIAACFATSPISADSGRAPKTAEAVKQENILSARFLNMLNHNFVYNSDFECVDDMINSSMPALLELRDENDPEFIAEGYVKGYIKDMFGIEIEDMSGLNAEFPHKDGFVYILPRGFADYHHELISVAENEDGSFTVTTNVTVGCHDSEAESFKAVTLFVKNEASSFGFNIIYSNILFDSADI